VLFEATGRDALRFGNEPHHLGQVFDVAPHVFAVRRQVDDRVANELSRRVQGDVTAATRLDHFDA